MERKDVTVWQPLADSFNDANVAFRERLKTRGGKEIKGFFKQLSRIVLMFCGAL
jgi:hypothetical protein